MARKSSEVVVIMWRDIPAQVNGKSGGERHQVLLPHRFQKAIDRAAMIAEKKTAQEYVGEWRRTSYPLTGDLVATIDEIAQRMEDEFSNERLMTLVDNGGWDPAAPNPTAPTPASPTPTAPTLPNETDQTSND